MMIDRTLKSGFGMVLLFSLVVAGAHAAEKNTAESTLSTEVISGTVAVVDQKNHFIRVGGTRVEMPPVGEIPLKAGQSVNLFVYRDKGKVKYLGIKRSSGKPEEVGR